MRQHNLKTFWGLRLAYIFIRSGLHGKKKQKQKKHYNKHFVGKLHNSIEPVIDQR